MEEKLSPFRRATIEYKGNVSTIAVKDIAPSGLEDLFKGVVVADNIFFKKGEEINFKYYSPKGEGYELFFSDSEVKYPVLSGIAFVDASVLVRRQNTH
jgi:hypothetical protein